VTTDVYIPPNTIKLETMQSGRGGEIVLTLATPDGNKDTAEIIKYPISNPRTIADSTAAGGWMKLKISSSYEGAVAYVKIEKVQG
jgi:hypothetical protein